MNTMRLVSLNVNGLKDTEKRSRVFRWLKSLNVHIIYLQETNFTFIRPTIIGTAVG